MYNADAIFIACIQAVGGDHIFGVMIRNLHKIAYFPVRVFRQPDTDLDIDLLLPTDTDEVDLPGCVFPDINLVACLLYTSRCV